MDLPVGNGIITYYQLIILPNVTDVQPFFARWQRATISSSRNMRNPRLTEEINSKNENENQADPEQYLELVRRHQSGLAILSFYHITPLSLITDKRQSVIPETDITVPPTPPHFYDYKIISKRNRERV